MFGPFWIEWGCWRHISIRSLYFLIIAVVADGDGAQKRILEARALDENNMIGRFHKYSRSRKCTKDGCGPWREEASFNDGIGTPIRAPEPNIVSEEGIVGVSFHLQDDGRLINSGRALLRTTMSYNCYRSSTFSSNSRHEDSVKWHETQKVNFSRFD